MHVMKELLAAPDPAHDVLDALTARTHSIIGSADGQEFQFATCGKAKENENNFLRSKRQVTRVIWELREKDEAYIIVVSQRDFLHERLEQSQCSKHTLRSSARQPCMQDTVNTLSESETSLKTELRQVRHVKDSMKNTASKLSQDVCHLSKNTAQLSQDSCS